MFFFLGTEGLVGHGCCDLETAEQVSMTSGESEIDILEELASLVDKSLLRQEEQADGQPRFGMLQTLRAFALEYLANAGETQATRQVPVHPDLLSLAFDRHELQ